MDAKLSAGVGDAMVPQKWKEWSMSKMAEFEHDDYSRLSGQCGMGIVGKVANTERGRWGGEVGGNRCRGKGSIPEDDIRCATEWSNCNAVAQQSRNYVVVPRADVVLR